MGRAGPAHTRTPAGTQVFLGFFLIRVYLVLFGATLMFTSVSRSESVLRHFGFLRFQVGTGLFSTPPRPPGPD